MFYRVTLLNDSVSKVQADIVPQGDEVISYLITTESGKMKQHLNKLLSMDAYVLAPIRTSGNLFTDGVMHIYPYTKQQALALPEILSWKGYKVEIIREVHKSVELLEGDYVVKSAYDMNIYTNAQGERIVKKVPSGYVAMSHDGRVVAAGGYINANIDKADATWQLYANPYEQMDEKQREQVEKHMQMGMSQYHPGAHNSLYSHPKDESAPKFEAKGKTTHMKGKKLSEHYPAPKKEEPPKKKPSTNLPMEMPEGKVIYSPSAGLILSSEFWPPTQSEGWENHEWYVFDDDVEPEMKPILGAGLAHPKFFQGLEGGVQKVNGTLSLTDGFRMNVQRKITGGKKNLDGIKVNEIETPEYPLNEMESNQFLKSKIKDMQISLGKVHSYTKAKGEGGERTLSNALKQVEIDDLVGMEARWVKNFEGREYQKAGVLALTDTSQYEIYGGPKGHHGHFLNWKYGLGKTGVVTAADAVMRNRGDFRDDQITLVTAPNKNVRVWEHEIGFFREEGATVIDGGREDRIQQWETLLDEIENGELTNKFVVVGSSKFRRVQTDDVDEDEQWELGVDATYMKLLAQGGSSDGRKVEGNHIAAFTIDETGQYVNSGSARHSALMEVVDAVYKGKGITWTLNGDISGNSATDTISEMAFVNKYARDNYMELTQTYTVDRDTNARSKAMGKRVWRNWQAKINFMNNWGSQIFNLDGKTVAGDEYGLVEHEDLGSPLGANWGSVYTQAASKLQHAAASDAMDKTLGLMSILINSSFGAVHPARLLEYDLGNKKLIQGVAKELGAEGLGTFRQELDEFLAATTEQNNVYGIGRLPIESMPVNEREQNYNSIFSEASKNAIENTLQSWNNPILDNVVEQMKVRARDWGGEENLKMGFAGFSKRAVRNLYVKLQQEFPDALVQVVDGDVDAEKVGSIQQAHQTEKEKNVISLVTGAGLYGLSLPSDVSWRLPTWNSAKGGQYAGRFHRSPTQKNEITVTVPDGIAQYMRSIEKEKESMAETAVAALVADDEGEELNISNVKSVSGLLNILGSYTPRINEREI